MRIFQQRQKFVSSSVVLSCLIGVMEFIDLYKPMEVAATAQAEKVSSAKFTKASPRKLSIPGPTSWRSFRNGNHQLGVAKSKLPLDLKLIWEIPAAEGVVSAAAIVADRIYASVLSGELRCLDRKSGKRIWTYSSAKKDNQKRFIPGFQSSPTVTAESVFLGDEDGVFHAVDRATGKTRWTFQAKAQIISATAVINDRVIFGSYDSSLYCLNAKDGSKVWQFVTEDRINGSPAIVDRFTFVTGCDEHLRVINIETGRQETNMQLGTYLIASPAVMKDTLYVGTYASEVLAINWKTSEIVWKYKDSKREFPYHSSAAVTNKFVVIGGRDKQLHCIDRKMGRRVWVFPTRGRVDSSPVVVGNRVFFGSTDGNLYGLDLESGTQVWKFNTGQSITASPAVGEGCLVIGTEGSKGGIYCFGG